jgi:hypothetical protein
MASFFSVSKVASARRVPHEADTLYAESARVARCCQGAARVLEDARAELAVRPPSAAWLAARSYCASARKPRRMEAA